MRDVRDVAERLTHTQGAPYHPVTQGKIERYHRLMKNVVKLEKYGSPWELERSLARFVADDNHRRYHESLQNVTPTPSAVSPIIRPTSDGVEVASGLETRQ